jgi:hypothetical protein
MRFVVASLALILTLGTAFGQVPPATPGGPARTPKQVAEDGVQECVRLWDAKTHMSKVEWVRTCKRIQSRLENLKIENLDLTGTNMRKKTGKEGSTGPTGRIN